MKNNIVKLLVIFIITGSLANASTLSLTHAYDLALKNSNKINSLDYQAKSSKENINQAKSRLYPQINFSTSYKKTIYKQNNASNTTIDQGLISASLTMSQSIYNKEINSKIKLEESRSKLYDINVQLAKEDLLRVITDTYINLLKSDSKLELLKANLKYTKTKYKEIEKKFDKNIANKVDLLQIKVQYNNAKLSLIKEKRNYIVYKSKLSQLTGDTSFILPNSNLKIPTIKSIEQLKNTIKNNDDYLKSLNIIQAKESINLSQLMLQNTKDSDSMRIDLDLSSSMYETDTPTTDAPYSNINQARVTLNIPIYNGGYAQSKILASKILKKSAVEEFEQSKKDIQIQYNENRSYFESSIDSILLYAETLEASKLYLESIQKSYDYDLKSISDLNDAYIKYYEIKYNYFDTLYEIANSYINLLIYTNNIKDLDLLDNIITTE
jgi:outer membrane protein